MKAAFQAAVYRGFSGKYGKRPRAAACREIVPNCKSACEICNNIFLNRPEPRSIFLLGRRELFDCFLGFEAIASNKKDRQGGGAELFFPDERKSGQGRQLVFSRNDQYAQC